MLKGKLAGWQIQHKFLWLELSSVIYVMSDVKSKYMHVLGLQKRCFWEMVFLPPSPLKKGFGRKWQKWQVWFYPQKNPRAHRTPESEDNDENGRYRSSKIMVYQKVWFLQLCMLTFKQHQEITTWMWTFGQDRTTGWLRDRFVNSEAHYWLMNIARFVCWPWWRFQHELTSENFGSLTKSNYPKILTSW